MSYPNQKPDEFLTGCDHMIKYAFDVEWYDPKSMMVNFFWLNFFPSDGAIEMYDKKHKKIFLHRCFVPGVTLDKLFVGNTVTIFGRLVKVLDYASTFTRRQVLIKQQKTFAMLKPGTKAKLGPIFDCINLCGLKVTRLRMCQLTGEEALAFYAAEKSKPYISKIINLMRSEPVIALELVGENAIEKWRQVMGPKDPIEARHSVPDSLRAAYGFDTAVNGFHGAVDQEAVDKEMDFFFPQTRPAPKTTACYENSTLCIVKPHVLKDGTLGSIFADINNAGFKIQAMFSTILSLTNADEFMEIYRGVIEDYSETILHLASNPCIAMEIKANDSNVNTFSEFRKLCGPLDPELARQVRPDSLRAKYGISRIYNAVHCTDLETDCYSDVEYFFKLIDGVVA